MYVDAVFLLLIYVFASIALGVSIYALWTLKELQDYYKARDSKLRQIKRSMPPIPVKQKKGHWD